MPHELALYVTEYGYLAIFSLVFLQEIGVPNPVPNELILLFSGYLAWTGVLSFPLVILSVVAGDFIGTAVLYGTFYLFGHIILEKKPKWFPLNHERLERLKGFISRDWWGIFLGRLLPYVRGYASVAAGLIQLTPRVFLPLVLLSAIVWSGGYVFAGKLIGPHWERAMQEIGATTNTVYLFIGGALVALTLFQLYKYLKRRRAAHHAEHQHHAQ